MVGDLLIWQRDHRIHSQRPAHRNVAGQQRTAAMTTDTPANVPGSFGRTPNNMLSMSRTTMNDTEMPDPTPESYGRKRYFCVARIMRSVYGCNFGMAAWNHNQETLFLAGKFGSMSGALQGPAATGSICEGCRKFFGR
jgi:hypothetical protein